MCCQNSTVATTTTTVAVAGCHRVDYLRLIRDGDCWWEAIKSGWNGISHDSLGVRRHERSPPFDFHFHL